MYALRFEEVGEPAWRSVPDPRIQDPEDVIVRVDATTICGTDLHIVDGSGARVAPGTVLGHEAVGTVVEAGSAVRSAVKGHRVVIPCISSCGRCPSCRHHSYSQCSGGAAWQLGNRIDGTHAEYVRVPFADFSTYRLPDDITDEHALLLSDVLPTAYEIGTPPGTLAPGASVAVVGTGPIGLAAILCARLFSPSLVIAVGRSRPRLEAARDFGADHVLAQGEDIAERVRALTPDGLGVDLAIEAVGSDPAFGLCARIVRPRGRIANTGVHTDPVSLPLDALWNRNVTVSTGQVDTYSIPDLLMLLRTRRLPVDGLITHRMPLHRLPDAYALLADRRDELVLKIALLREGAS
ncbi:alcohol dehydrogenase catalytic domain-containing protein [Streptomyces sp. NPDC005012]|uniref:alcohol dehydrogenase catalytic domain-containing protein n=1 Tax=Streptomyces sp. NPDC005012 TaxID=3154558 RepID=UPI0033A78CF1